MATSARFRPKTLEAVTRLVNVVDRIRASACGAGKPGDPGFDPNNTCQSGGPSAKPKPGGGGGGNKPKPADKPAAKPKPKPADKPAAKPADKPAAGGGKIEVGKHFKKLSGDKVDSTGGSSARDVVGGQGTSNMSPTSF